VNNGDRIYIYNGWLEEEEEEEEGKKKKKKKKNVNNLYIIHAISLSTGNS
jgi:hypothetical protein